MQEVTQFAAMRHLTICAATGAVGKDVGANLHPTIVLNHPGRIDLVKSGGSPLMQWIHPQRPQPAIWRHHSSIHSAPVTLRSRVQG